MAAGRGGGHGILVEQLFDDDAGAFGSQLRRDRQQCLGTPANVIGLPQGLDRGGHERQAHRPRESGLPGPHPPAATATSVELGEDLDAGLRTALRKRGSS